MSCICGEAPCEIKKKNKFCRARSMTDVIICVNFGVKGVV